jgi:hypothetical protein
MIIKHSSSFHGSEVMRELERQSRRKGHFDLKPDEIVRLAAREVTAETNLRPSADLDQDIAKLVTALEKNGYKKNAADIAKNYVIFKQAQASLYGVGKESNEDITNMAHSDGDAFIADARDENGKVETILSAAKKIREIANKNPSGKTGSSKKELSKTAQEAGNYKDKVRGIFESIGGILETFTIPSVSFANITWSPPNVDDKATLMYCRLPSVNINPQNITAYSNIYSLVKTHANATSVDSLIKLLGRPSDRLGKLDSAQAKAIAQNLSLRYNPDSDPNKEVSNIAEALYARYNQLYATIWGVNNSKYNAANQQITSYINNITEYIHKQGQRLISPSEWKTFNVQAADGSIQEAGVDKLISSARSEVVKTLNSAEAKYVGELSMALGRKDIIKEWLTDSLPKIDSIIGQLGLNRADASTIDSAKEMLGILWKAKSSVSDPADAKFLTAVASIVQQLTDGRLQSLQGVNDKLARACASFNVPQTIYSSWDQLFTDLRDLAGQTKMSPAKVNIEVGEAALEPTAASKTSNIKIAKLELPSVAKGKPATKSTKPQAGPKEEGVARGVDAPAAVESMQQMLTRLTAVTDSLKKIREESGKPRPPEPGEIEGAELIIADDGKWGPKTTKALEAASKIVEGLIINAPKESAELEAAAKKNTDAIGSVLRQHGFNPNTGAKYTPIDRVDEQRGNFPTGSPTDVYPQDVSSIQDFYSFLLEKLKLKPAKERDVTPEKDKVTSAVSVVGDPEIQRRFSDEQTNLSRAYGEGTAEKMVDWAAKICQTNDPNTIASSAAKIAKRYPRLSQIMSDRASKLREPRAAASQAHNLVRIANSILRKRGQAELDEPQPELPAVPGDWAEASTASWITAKQFSDAIDWFLNRSKTMRDYVVKNKPAQSKTAEFYYQSMNSIKNSWEAIKGGIDIYAKVDPEFLTRSAPKAVSAKSPGAKGEEGVGRGMGRTDDAKGGRAGRGIGLTPAEVNDGPFNRDSIDFYKLAGAYIPQLIPWMDANMSATEISSNDLHKGGDGNATCPDWVRLYKRSDNRYGGNDRNFLNDLFNNLLQIIQTSFEGWWSQTQTLKDTPDLKSLRNNQTALRNFWIHTVGSAQDRISTWTGGVPAQPTAQPRPAYYRGR